MNKGILTKQMSAGNLKRTVNLKDKITYNWTLDTGQ